MDISARQYEILVALLGGVTSVPSFRSLPTFKEVTERTLQRDLGELVKKRMVIREGEARAVTYHVPMRGRLDLTLPDKVLETLFANEDRAAVAYDFERLNMLGEAVLFSHAERTVLTECATGFHKRLASIDPDILRRERERVTIELSWKSSQIEGNTYTLLETESLLNEGVPAQGKSKDETVMVLNHKRALDFTDTNKELFAGPITADLVTELHRILAEGLMGDGLRRHPVGITGSVYQPLGVHFQIREELGRFCETVNAKQDPFEKALLAFVYICYLQPFNDGNKRTSRILANAILYAYDLFPLSLRAVSVPEYKLAIIAFYELFVLGNAKRLLVEQGTYALKHYAV